MVNSAVCGVKTTGAFRALFGAAICPVRDARDSLGLLTVSRLNSPVPESLITAH